MSFNLYAFLPFLLNRAGSEIAQQFSQILKEQDLSIGAWRVLAGLYHRDGQRVGELAQSTSIELWTVSRLVSSMEERGLIHRVRTAGDARSVTVTLLPDGVAAVEAVIPEAMEREQKLLEGFTDHEVMQLKSYLERIHATMRLWDDEDEEEISVDGAGPKVIAPAQRLSAE